MILDKFRLDDKVALVTGAAAGLGAAIAVALAEAGAHVVAHGNSRAPICEPTIPVALQRDETRNRQIVERIPAGRCLLCGKTYKRKQNRKDRKAGREVS
jgi:NAD(P)-dependent dehydrogenase (short-subunit alcohol dehydrogenase family)